MTKHIPEDSKMQHGGDDDYSSVYHQTMTNPNNNFITGTEISRDPDDILTIFSLLRKVSILLVLLVISIGTNVFLAVRRADRIVVDKSSGRVVELNNRDYGATETVEITPDRPNDTDKKYLVKEFLKSLYQVEQTTRETEVNKLLRMLDPDLSLSLAARFKQNGILTTEKAESVNSTWELQDLSVDERDPYILRAIGIRRIRRQANGQDLQESLQLKCKFLLKDSSNSPARNDNNLRTGFTILRFRVEPVSGKTQSPIALLADGDDPNGEIDPASKTLENQTNPAAGETGSHK
ncbi:MAG TPA: hypothetical protein PKY82_07320 [Pyrinomonadaceae bacterium]|nr:hypothetical protein [Pyrinomonadaceae bacterium]